MRKPRPFCGPPKYSATNAVITAFGAAILSAVNRYGMAFGIRALTRTCRRRRGVGPQQLEVGRLDLAQALGDVDEHDEEHDSVTISRRGISDVMANMLLNTDTSTMIGIAFSATASGVDAAR